MNRFKTEYVPMEWGDQLKFAVPPEGENEPSVDIFDEIKDEVMSVINGLANEWYIDFKSIPHHKINQLASEVEKIFEKYSK